MSSPSRSKAPGKPAVAQVATGGGVSAATRRFLPWLVAVALFMELLDTTILNTAVPIVSKALGVTPLSMRSVLASYTLSLAVFIPISGWMADRFGTRRVFASAIGLFIFGSLLCGLATEIHFLVACRILQGCGGAMMTPVGRIVLVRTFPKSQLVQAMSFMAMPALIGPMLGPLIGGLIVSYLNWRFIFFVNIPIGIAGLILARRHLPDYRGEAKRPVDILGLILFGSGIALLSYVLEIFGEHALGPGEIVGLLAISFVLIFGYGLHSLRTPYPLLQLDLFRNRTFATAVSGSFVTRLGVGGAPFLLPLLYQIGLGRTPVESGLLIMPQAAAAISSKFFLPAVLRRLGHRTLLNVNTIGTGVFLMLFATVGLGTPIWLIVLQAFCYGVLVSTQFTCMNTLTYADVPGERASAASSIASTLQQLSMSFGIAAAGLTTALFIPLQLRSSPKAATSGLHHAFLAIGAFTILSTLIFSRLRPEDGIPATRRKNIQSG